MNIQHIYRLLENVTDPEIPVLSVIDMGIVRDVKTDGDAVEVVITPTYSGCPAMSVIATAIRFELMAQGINPVTVTEVLSPAWTTDWMTENGKQKLREYGIAPPMAKARIDKLLFEAPTAVPCPHCGAAHTEQISEFGSTACKSLYRCLECREPFDYFRCH